MLEMVPSGEAIACQLISLRRVIDQLEFKFSQLAAEFDQTDWWDYEGFNSSGDWIRFNCRMTSNAAYDRLTVGERLADLPRSTDAMGWGRDRLCPSRSHGADGGGGRQRFRGSQAASPRPRTFTGQVPLQMPPLPALGRLQGLRRGAERAAVQPPPLPEHGRVRPPPDQRRPRPGRRGGGAHGPGAVGAEPAGVPAPWLRGGADDRLLPQRYADALVELASAGRPANIQVTATIETLKGMAGAGAAEMEFALPISSVAVQRMACDCSVTRVLPSQESLVMDV